MIKINSKTKIIISLVLAMVIIVVSFAIVLSKCTGGGNIFSPKENKINFENYAEGSLKKINEGKLKSGNFSIVKEKDNKVLKVSLDKKVELEISNSSAQKTLQYDFKFTNEFLNEYNGIYTVLRRNDKSNTGIGSVVLPKNDNQVNTVCYIPQLTWQSGVADIKSDTWYTYKAQLTDNIIRIKVWKRTDKEPNTWNALQILEKEYTKANKFSSSVIYIPKNSGNGELFLDNIYITKFAAKDETHVNVVASPVAGGSVFGKGYYQKNDTAVVKAQPREGYSFIGWRTADGKELSKDAEYAFKVTQNITVKAIFEKSEKGMVSPMKISAFTANGQTEQAVINNKNKTVDLRLASDVDLKNVICYYYTDVDSGVRCEYTLDLSTKTAKIGEGDDAWTINAVQNPVMMSLYVNNATGSDSNDGKTADNAFKTIEKAKETIKAVKNWSGDIQVIIAKGEYVLDKTLKVGVEDSAQKGYTVIYKGEEQGKTVISGGKAVTGWKKLTSATAPEGLPTATASNVWVADAPAGIEYSRDLYVNGVRATLASSGALKNANFKYWAHKGYTITGEWTKIADWKNPTDIEFVYEIAWTYSVIPVSSIKTSEDGTVTVNMLKRAFACIHDKTSASLQYESNKNPGSIQNAIELLDSPGEWYFDRTDRKIYYYPKDGASPNNQSVIIPTLEKLVEVKGEAAEVGTTDKADDTVPANYVYGITFKDIAFRYASYLEPHTEGRVEIQANFTAKDFPSTLFTRYKTEGAVTFNYAQGARVEGCSFTAFSSSALDFGEGVSGATICNNNFQGIGGSAIQVGDVAMRDAQPFSPTYYKDDVTLVENSDSDPWRITKNILVFSNRINDIGTQFKGSIGIFGGYVTDLTISHNEISNTPYSGISIGWGWGEIDSNSAAKGRWGSFTTDSTQLRYVVENNNISNCMQRLVDGGGIYTLSYMPGSILRGNVIHDITGSTLRFAIYNDQASGGFVDMSENVSWNLESKNDYHYQLTGPQYNKESDKACNAMMAVGNYIDRTTAPTPAEAEAYAIVQRSGVKGKIPVIPN